MDNYLGILTTSERRFHLRENFNEPFFRKSELLKFYTHIKELMAYRKMNYQAGLIKESGMKNKKIKQIISASLLFCGIYSLYSAYSYRSVGLSDFQNSIQLLNNETLSMHVLMPSYLKNRPLAFHQVYESRQVGFPKDIKASKTSNETKTILLWTPWNGVTKTINYYSLQPGEEFFTHYNCPNPKCIATYDRNYLQKADAVFFHLLDIEPSNLPHIRTAKQLWILYDMEAPWQIRKNVPELNRLNHLFNWTMTYRSDANVVARYGFITPTESTTSYRFREKTKNVVWFVSDCNTDSKREEYVNELSKHIEVDVYGKCGNKRCYPSQSATCYEEVMEKYKFYLSFENSLCKDYVTEKFFNIFNYNIIPVVFGAVNYSSIAPEGTFIDAMKFPEPRLLAQHLLEISSKSDIYNNMLLKKRSFKSYLDPWMCRLCDALHKDVEHSILSDADEWWIKKAQCRTWDKTEFKFIDKK